MRDREGFDRVITDHGKRASRNIDYYVADDGSLCDAKNMAIALKCLPDADLIIDECQFLPLVTVDALIKHSSKYQVTVAGLRFDWKMGEFEATRKLMMHSSEIVTPISYCICGRIAICDSLNAAADDPLNAEYIPLCWACHPESR